MASLFDDYRNGYREAVEGSIGFSGLGHDFFLKAKADLLRRLMVERGIEQGGAGVRALDVGCGIGSLHRHLKGVFASLDGCDVSEESIVRACTDNPDNAYRVCTSAALPFDDGVFDLAFASCVLHHVAPDAWHDFFREMRRVLRPGGMACIIEHNPWNPLTRLAVLRCPFDNDAVLLRARKVEALFRATGFRGNPVGAFPAFAAGRPAGQEAGARSPLFPSVPNMRAVRAPEKQLVGFGPKLLLRFGLVGIAATALYAILATLFMNRIGLDAVPASLAAYAAAALFSYLAHKSQTFMSRGRHRTEAPRFMLLTAAGLAVAYAAPALLTGVLGLAGHRPCAGHMHPDPGAQSPGARTVGVCAAEAGSVAPASHPRSPGPA